MIKNFNIETQLQQIVSAEQAYHYRIVPHHQHNGSIAFKTDNPNQESLKNELRIILGKKLN